jgi:hypothetical protein
MLLNAQVTLFMCEELAHWFVEPFSHVQFVLTCILHFSEFVLFNHCSVVNWSIIKSHLQLSPLFGNNRLWDWCFKEIFTQIPSHSLLSVTGIKQKP